MASCPSPRFNRPTVIGTGRATSTIRTGDLVEVNATNGVVEIIERAGIGLGLGGEDRGLSVERDVEQVAREARRQVDEEARVLLQLAEAALLAYVGPPLGGLCTPFLERLRLEHHLSVLRLEALVASLETTTPMRQTGVSMTSISRVAVGSTPSSTISSSVG